MLAARLYSSGPLCCTSRRLSLRHRDPSPFASISVLDLFASRPAAVCSAATPTMAPGGIWERLTKVYNDALAAQQGGVFKTETDDKLVHDERYDVQFVLRVATALNSKPRPAGNSGRLEDPRSCPCEPVLSAVCICRPLFLYAFTQSLHRVQNALLLRSKSTPANPFLPHEEALFVCDLSPSHKLLLNKFNVVEHHSLVVTREFQAQTDPLNERDFDAALQVLRVRTNSAAIVAALRAGSAAEALGDEAQYSVRMSGDVGHGAICAGLLCTGNAVRRHCILQQWAILRRQPATQASAGDRLKLPVPLACHMCCCVPKWLSHFSPQ